MESSFFPITTMEKFFVVVNHDKKEFICPWCTGSANHLGLMAALQRNPEDEFEEDAPPNWVGVLNDPASFCGRWGGGVLDIVSLGDEQYEQTLWDYKNVSQEAMYEWLRYEERRLAQRQDRRCC